MNSNPRSNTLRPLFTQGEVSRLQFKEERPLVVVGGCCQGHKRGKSICALCDIKATFQREGGVNKMGDYGYREILRFALLLPTKGGTNCVYSES